MFCGVRVPSFFQLFVTRACLLRPPSSSSQDRVRRGAHRCAGENRREGKIPLCCALRVLYCGVVWCGVLCVWFSSLPWSLPPLPARSLPSHSLQPLFLPCSSPPLTSSSPLSAVPPPVAEGAPPRPHQGGVDQGGGRHRPRRGHPRRRRQRQVVSHRPGPPGAPGEAGAGAVVQPPRSVVEQGPVERGTYSSTRTCGGKRSFLPSSLSIRSPVHQLTPSPPPPLSLPISPPSLSPRNPLSPKPPLFRKRTLH